MVVYPNEEEAKCGSHRFLDFVDKTFALLTKSPIKKFSLSHRGKTSSRLYRWIWTSMERGLLELHLDSTRFGVVLEKELFTSNTLVKLTLSGGYYLQVKRVFFPVLKSLSILSTGRLDHENCQRLVVGCPVLEELYITDATSGDNPPCCGAYVENASIKRLVLFVNLPGSKHFHYQTYVKAPSLVYLDYSSRVFLDYQFVDLDSLVEARLNLTLWESTNDDDGYCADSDDDDGYYHTNVEPKKILGDVTKLAAGISNITTLYLSPDSLEVFHFCCKSMPVFNNLLKLSIESNREKGWQGLVHRVTDNCGDACACIPKNKQKKTKEDKSVSCLWTCQVKVLEISEYGGSFQELKQMRHFLSKLGCLETVRAGVDADKNNSELLRANLLAIPMLSSKCNNIQFI